MTAQTYRTDDHPLTTLEAVLRTRAHLWGIASTVCMRTAGRCWDWATAAEARELDLLTDAEEVRHAVLLARKDTE